MMLLSLYHLIISFFQINQMISAGPASPDIETRTLIKRPNEGDITCGPFYGNPVDTACEALLGLMIDLHGADAIAPFGRVAPPPEPDRETEDGNCRIDILPDASISPQPEGVSWNVVRSVVGRVLDTCSRNVEGEAYGGQALTSNGDLLVMVLGPDLFFSDENFRFVRVGNAQPEVYRAGGLAEMAISYLLGSCMRNLDIHKPDIQHGQASPAASVPVICSLTYCEERCECCPTERCEQRQVQSPAILFGEGILSAISMCVSVFKD
ncbi:MAG: hypothetical protein M1835_008223 [Candelina submexicana]|nr:MAG: hypothetical protein M1835_008223 [Candelina submexicana]